MTLVQPPPPLPSLGEQPAVVAILDQIRRAQGYDEFTWFIREYPRNFRYFWYRAEHRLKAIHSQYRWAADQASASANDATTVSLGWGRDRAWETYWDFEDYLNALNSALDTLARVVAPYYPQPTPPSFSRVARRLDLGGIAEDFRNANARWVQRMKDYRDCFTHYAPVDNEAFIRAVRGRDGAFLILCPLPTNPNERETEHFRYSRRLDVLSYSLTLHRHLRALDRKVSRRIESAWKAGEFPRRRHGLFGVGARQRRAEPGYALRSRDA